MDGCQSDENNPQKLMGIHRIVVLGVIGIGLGLSACTGDTSEKLEESDKIEQARKKLQEKRMEKILDPSLDLVTRQIEIEYLLRSMGENDAYEAIKKILASERVNNELAKFAMKNMDKAGSAGACFLITAMVPTQNPEIVMHATETFNRVLLKKIVGEKEIADLRCLAAIQSPDGNTKNFISGNYLFIISNMLADVQNRMGNEARGSKEWWQLKSAADNLMQAKTILTRECPTCEIDKNCRMDRPTKFRVRPNQMQISRRAPVRVARRKC